MKKLNFMLQELIYSDKAFDRGIDNNPLVPSIYQNLMYLILYILQPLRDGIGKPVLISSGYRCPELNEAVGGVNRSKHTYGLAADINNGSKAKNLEVYRWLLQHSLELPIDELICEEGGKWIHVSLDINKMSRMFD